MSHTRYVEYTNKQFYLHRDQDDRGNRWSLIYFRNLTEIRNSFLNLLYQLVLIMRFELRLLVYSFPLSESQMTGNYIWLSWLPNISPVTEKGCTPRDGWKAFGAWRVRKRAVYRKKKKFRVQNLSVSTYACKGRGVLNTSVKIYSDWVEREASKGF